MFVCAVGVEHLKADLAAGRIACPGSGGPLARCGLERERPVRTLRAVRPLRPRRAVCHPRAKPHVLLTAWSPPRRRYGTDVIIAALLNAAAGQGHHMIAARLDRPPGHDARLATARPSPRGRDPPAGQRDAAARRFRNAWPSDGRRPGPLTIPRGCDPLASVRGYGSWVRVGGASGEGE